MYSNPAPTTSKQDPVDFTARITECIAAEKVRSLSERSLKELHVQLSRFNLYCRENRLENPDHCTPPSVWACMHGSTAQMSEDNNEKSLVKRSFPPLAFRIWISISFLSKSQTSVQCTHRL